MTTFNWQQKFHSCQSKQTIGINCEVVHAGWELWCYLVERGLHAGTPEGFVCVLGGRGHVLAGHALPRRSGRDAAHPEADTVAELGLPGPPPALRALQPRSRAPLSRASSHGSSKPASSSSCLNSHTIKPVSSPNRACLSPGLESSGLFRTCLGYIFP